MIPDFYDLKKKCVQLEDGREQGQLNEQLCREVYGGQSEADLVLPSD